MLKLKAGKLGVVLLGVLFSSGVFAEPLSQFKLLSVGKSQTPGFVTKIYSVSGPLKVNYTYFVDEMGAYNYALGFRIINDNRGLIPSDLKDAYLDAGGDGDKTVRGLGIVKPPKDGCHFEGTAIVHLGNISLDLPEYPTSSESSVLVKKIISSTPPKLKCE